jgi:hypothetical protein
MPTAGVEGRHRGTRQELLLFMAIFTLWIDVSLFKEQKISVGFFSNTDGHQAKT